VGNETSALCSGVQLSSNASGPVTGSVTLSASGATCGAGETAEYRFVQRRDGTTAMVELQNWSATSTFAWNTTGLPSGSYHAFVYARAAGSSKYQSYDSISLLLGQVCNGITLSSSAASPQSVGTVVGLTAAATCTGGTAEYQFTAKGRSGSSLTIQDWSSSATASWNTAGLAADSYTITASTRKSGNLAVEAQKLLAFRLGETCAVPTLGTSPSSPSSLGADVTLNAATTCTGAAGPEYRFSYRPSAGGAYVQIRDWGSGASTVWHTAGLPADNYTLSVETRANDYAGPTQARKIATFVIGGSCSAVTLVGSPKSPPPLNATLSFTASSTCSGGSPEYRFLVRAAGATSYSEFRGWGSGSASFPTTGLAGGAYAFKVETRVIGSVAAYQAQRALAYDLGGVCNGVTLSPSPASPAVASASVQLSANATCVNGGVPEYQFAARAAGATAFTVLRDWGSSSAVWDTSQLPWNAAGDYQLRVSARGQGQLGPAESTRTISYSLTGCPSGYQPVAGVCTPLAVAASQPVAASCNRLITNDPTANGYFQIQTVRTNAAGEIIVAGEFDGTINIGGAQHSSTKAGDIDVFVAKLDANCNRVFSHSYGDAAMQSLQPGVLAVDAAGNVFFSFYNQGSINLGDGVRTGHLIVARLSPSGATDWSREYDPTFGGTTSLATDSSGNVLLAGNFTGPLSFGGAPLDSANWSIFVAKLDGAGQHLWSETFTGIDIGSTNPQRGLAVDPVGGDLLIAGGFYGDVTFGSTTLQNSVTLTSYTAKLRGSDGAVVWATAVPSTSLVQAAVNGSGGNVVVGKTMPGQNAYLVSFDSAGNIQDTKTFPGADWTSCAVDGAGNRIAAGTIKQTVNFGGGNLALPAGANMQAAVASFAPGGAHLWSRAFGKTHDTVFTSVTINPAHALEFGVTMDGTADFGQGDLSSQYALLPVNHGGGHDGAVVHF
jgi:hypothetical protein